MAGTLRNVQPGQVVTVHTKLGPRCMTKVVNPTGRTRFKGQFVCNSACGLPTKRPSRRCGMGQRMMPQMGYQPRPMLGYQAPGF
jgi:hypothetical protein